VARQFPTISDFASALRFALEAERAGADFAAAAQVAAPDQEWRDRFEELVCTHDDRVEKLGAVRFEGDASARESLRDLATGDCVEVLGAEPATGWPEAAEQLAAVEEAIAADLEDFAARGEGVLASRAPTFKKAAQQNRQAADDIRSGLS
jgi:hypothetical protein